MIKFDSVENIFLIKGIHCDNTMMLQLICISGTNNSYLRFLNHSERASPKNTKKTEINKTRMIGPAPEGIVTTICWINGNNNVRDTWASSIKKKNVMNKGVNWGSSICNNISKKIMSMERTMLTIDYTDVVSHSKKVEISVKKYLRNRNISAVIYI